MKHKLDEDVCMDGMVDGELDGVVPETHKRGSRCLDAIDFSPLKRRRCLDSSQQTELDPIYHRILSWMTEQQARGSLPKTFTKLSRATIPMCHALVQIDATVVFYHLIFNRIIIPMENPDGSVTYAANPEPVRGSFQGFVPDDSPELPFSEDFVRALERSTAWVLSNRGLHYFKGPESILSSLRQLCKFKREINPEHVVQLLRMRGFIYPGSGADEVCYDLTYVNSLPNSAPSHYSPSYTNYTDTI